jgi:hypothetical protein
MTERRTEDTGRLPHRSLAGPTAQDGDSRVPLSERVSAAIASAGQAAKAATGASEPRVGPATRPVGTGAPATPIGKRFETSPAARPTPGSGKVRKARLRLTHVDPWSVMKTAFLLAVALGIVTVVAVSVIWGVLGVAGVWDSINKTVVDVVGGTSADTFDIRNYLGTSRVMGFTMIVAVVDVVLITAIATLGAYIYNLSATLLGGLEVTLAEDDH